MIKGLATLARIAVTSEECAQFSNSLSGILSHMQALKAVDVTNVEPMYHAIDLHQRLAPDVVLEKNQRDLFQASAPLDAAGKRTVLAGLYLVPKVID